MNTEWIRLRNTTINWHIWHRINSNVFIKIIMLDNPFHSHWHFFKFELQNNQPLFRLTEHIRYCIFSLTWIWCQNYHNRIPQENCEQNLVDETNFIDMIIAWFTILIAVFVSIFVLSKIEWSAAGCLEMEFHVFNKSFEFHVLDMGTGHELIVY